MKQLLFYTLITIAFSVDAQNKKVVDLLGSIEGKWSQNEVTKNVTYVKVVDLPNQGKEDIYRLCDDFLLTLYDDIGKANVDKNFETGRLSSSGWFGEVYSGFVLATIYKVDVKHLLKIDAKDGKARISLSLTELKQYSSNGTYEYLVRDRYPVNINSGEKNFFGKSFYNTHIASLEMIDRFEKNLRSAASTETENDDW